MKKRQWKVRHSYVEQPDARSRWDRSYQSLIQWREAVLKDQPSSPLSQENSNEHCDVRSGFNESDKHKHKQSSSSYHGSREYSQKQGWEWNEEHIFRDDGYSGASLRRPGLDRLRDQVRNAAFDRVLVTEPSRLARNYVHQMLLMEEFERGGCQIEFVDQPMSRNPHDQLLVQIRGAVAEYERSLIAERMRRGRQQKYRAGILLRLYPASLWISRRSQPSTRPRRRTGGASRGGGGG